VIKPRRISWDRHAACMHIVLENLERVDDWVILGADGRIILKWILEKQGIKLGTGFKWFKIKSNGGLLYTQ
jgi:hypothetical protein